MFFWIGRFASRHRYIVVALWALALFIALPTLPGIEDALKVGGFGAGNTESDRTVALLENELGYSPSSMVVVYTSETLAASSDDFQRQVEASLDGVGSLPFVVDVVLPSLDPSLIAQSDRLAYAVVGLDLGPEEAQRYVDEFKAALIPQTDIDMIVAGAPAFYADIETASQRDLRRAEFIALPIALAALLVVFGTVVAALVPLVIGCASVAVILFCIFLTAQVTDISIFALNLATMLGLGLAVDYCLFVTSRFREELRRSSKDVDRAVTIAIATAGRAVVFSGLSVLVGLAGLTLFPIMFLRSVGVAGVIVVAVSTVAAVTLLPAVLSILGSRIERLSLRRGRRFQVTGDDEREGFWHGLAWSVMRHPVAVTVLTVGLLVSFGLPFLRANISSPDATILPGDLPSRQGFDLIAQEFSGGEISPFVLAIESPMSMFSPQNLQTVNSLVKLLESDPRITRVQSPVTLPGFPAGESPGAVVLARQVLELFGTETRLDAFLSARVAVIIAYPAEPANSPDNKDLLADLRRIGEPGDVTVLVGGGTASIVDVVDVIYDAFPLVALVIVSTTYCILLALFRSILLPLKAILMNVLSILASYGALVWIFQDGHFHRWLGFTPQGFVEASLPVIMFCVLFGLSMDYEVFLLSRVQEEYMRSNDNDASVATGLQRSGRIISSAALIVIVVTASFVSADVVLIKALGLGIALAVALDATIVRALLVPATMKLLGGANWWIPRWLDRLLPDPGPVDH